MIKLYYSNYGSNTWQDWTNYLIDPPKVSRRVESENAAEAGVVVYDNAGVTLREEVGNPVYAAYRQSELSGVMRHMYRVTERSKDGSELMLFEGMADFGSIKRPDMMMRLKFDILDKISALSLVQNKPMRQLKSLKNNYAFLPPLNWANGDFYEIDVNLNQGEGNIVIYKSVNGDAAIEYDPGYAVFEAGSILRLLTIPNPAQTPQQNTTENLLFIKSHWRDSGQTEGRLITWFEYEGSEELSGRYRIDSSNAEAYELSSVNRVLNYYGSGIYGYDISANYTVAISADVFKTVAAYDLLKIAKAIIWQAWPGLNIINRVGSNEYTIPAGYWKELITFDPFGKTPYDALKFAADTMMCYIYTDRQGQVVIQAKDKLGENGTLCSVGNSIAFEGGEESYFWDKLADACTVNVQGWIKDSNNEYISGSATYYKLVGESTDAIKPRNEITKDVCAKDISQNTVTALREYAMQIARRELQFYGLRHSFRQMSFHIDDNVLSWDLLDNIIIDGIKYFFQTFDLDLAARIADVELVEVEGHNYDIRQVIIPQGSSVSGSGGSSSGSLTNAKVMGDAATLNGKKASDFEAILTVRPETFGAKADGITDDTEAIRLAFAAAKNKKIVFSKATYKVSKRLDIDLEGQSIQAVGDPGARIVTSHSEPGSYYNPVGSINFTRASQFSMDNIKFETEINPIYPSGWQASDNAIKARPALVRIYDCDKVALDAVSFRKGELAGLHLSDIKIGAGLLNCICDNNKYAGLMYTAVKHLVILGGSFSYNGYNAYINGYGITATHQYGTGIDNTDIEISGVQANYNLRKGIDVHGGHKVHIHHSFVTGYGNAAIYAVNEAAEQGHVKFVRDVIIDHNNIENDAKWYSTLNIDVNYRAIYGSPTMPIQVGTYSEQAPLGSVDYPYGTVWESEAAGNSRSDWFTGGNGGSIVVEANTIKNCTVNYAGSNVLASLVHVFGSALRSVQIINNVFDRASCDCPVYLATAVLARGDAEGQPKTVNIAGNHFLNITAKGNLVFLNAGRKIKISGNVAHECTTTGGSAFSDRSGAFRIFEYGNGANIQTVKIIDNELDGSYQTGVIVENGTNVKLSETTFSGSFEKFWDISLNLPQQIDNNTYNYAFDEGGYKSISLPDYNSKNSGEKRIHIETSSVIPKSADILTVKADDYDGGVAQFDLEVMAVCANNAFRANYKLRAHCGRVGTGTPEFGVDDNYSCDFDDAGHAENDPEIFRPVLSWIGTGNMRTLQISCPTQYTSYYAVVRFAGWRNIPRPETGIPGLAEQATGKSFKYQKGRLGLNKKPTDTISLKGLAGENILGLYASDGSAALIVDRDKNGILYNSLHIRNKANSANLPFASRNTAGTEAVLDLANIGNISLSGQFVSSKATGAPFIIASAALVQNLNANLLEGNHSSAFAPSVHSHAISDVLGLQGTLDTKLNSSVYKLNSLNDAGYVKAGWGQLNQVWMTDASGNPDWRGLPVNSATRAGMVTSPDSAANKVWGTDASGVPGWIDKPTPGSTYTSWSLQVNGAASTNVLEGDTVNFIAGSNISLSKSGHSITIANTYSYAHPATHVASMITEDTSHRFVSDTEKDTWNGKAAGTHLHVKSQITDFAHTHAIADVTGLQAALDGKAASSHTHNYDNYGSWSLQVNSGTSSGITSGTIVNLLNGSNISITRSGNAVTVANTYSYTHPAAHAASMITEDSTHRFITDAERTAWNSSQGVSHNHSNLTTLAGITDTLVTNWNSAYSHAITAHVGTTGANASGTWGISISGTAKGVNTADPGIGTGGLWVITGSGLKVARNNTAYFVLDENNLTAYTVNKIGTGASGTWGISITGNAASANNADTLDGNHASAFSLASHTHTGYAASAHTHAIADVTGLQTALDGKAAAAHTHAGYALATHGHNASEIDYGQSVQQSLDAVIDDIYTQLNGKAATGHTHTIANVSGLQAALDAKAASVHDHTGISGNAATATKLATARTINGVPFDGSTNITIAAQAGAHTHTNDSSIGGPYALATHSHSEYQPLLTGSGSYSMGALNVTDGIICSNIQTGLFYFGGTDLTDDLASLRDGVSTEFYLQDNNGNQRYLQFQNGILVYCE